MKGYGQRIKDFREKSKIGQRELAEKMGIAQPSLSNLENSIHPPLDRIEQVCEILNIPLWRFFAPDNLVIPDMSEEQRRWNEAFDLLPSSLKIILLNQTKDLLEFYVACKQGKI